MINLNGEECSSCATLNFQRKTNVSFYGFDIVFFMIVLSTNYKPKRDTINLNLELLEFGGIRFQFGTSWDQIHMSQKTYAVASRDGTP